jgi:exodeoxyribonuclease V
MDDITLTVDQEVALAQIHEFIRGPGWAFTLEGHAGTGKTTLMRILARQLPEGSVAFTAPTNKATRVLREAVGTEHAFTIYSASGLVLQDDSERKYVAKGGEGNVGLYSLVIVDEASMIGAAMFREIEAAHLQYGTKFLFVGDSLQLPPVADSGGLAFELPKATLNQIVRQAADNPIIALGDFFRRLIRGEAASFRDLPRARPGEEGVHFQDHDVFYENMVASFCLGEGELRAIAWRNATVHQLAHRIRRAIYGEAVRSFEPNERVFTAKPLEQMYTDQEARVVEIKGQSPHPLYPLIEAVPIVLQPDIGPPVMAWAVADSSRADYEEQVRSMQERARELQRREPRGHIAREAWRDFHRFNDAFADLRSVHAITAHRSQGSTFDEVFVDLHDIRGCKQTEQRYRLLYVAVTRARRNVYLRE